MNKSAKISYEKFYDEMANALLYYCSQHVDGFFKSLQRDDSKIFFTALTEKTDHKVLREKLFIFYAWVALHFFKLGNEDTREKVAGVFWKRYFNRIKKALEIEDESSKEIKILAENITEQFKEYISEFNRAMETKSLFTFYSIVLKNLMNMDRIPLEYFSTIGVGINISTTIKSYAEIVEKWRGSMRFEEDGVVFLNKNDKILSKNN